MSQKRKFREKINQLVEIFDRNIDQYKTQSDSNFNEAQLREQFLNPMFKSLGWDMYNEQGFAEQYKEVVHEDKVEIKGKPKAPDYSFRIGGQRKFFLEAKKPSIKIKTDYDPALQLRRYAWSGHLPVSLLSDFEEFAIYDTTIEPKSSDKASVARVEYLTYDQYPNNWEKIYDTFAKESILKGSFDRYADKEKRGKQVVDKAFLEEIEKWREILAKDLAKNNSKLTVEELNFAVQRIIDRLIFLRIAEDRGIEPYKKLQTLIKSKNSYKELNKYFKVAQQKYNSNLFNFETDTLTPNLKVSDDILDKILKQLYYPTSPYVFDVIGVEVLGNIYEQFLGKVIRLTRAHNAKVEEKPEVKKAGGVYYTPKYIVDYIVKNTVGELLKRKNPQKVSKLKILDPACGSGSFLIGAYEYILDWHLNYYERQDEKEKKKLEKKGVIYRKESDDGVTSWFLTTQEKKRIMLNNIYGVDIDSQAVEVTKLSLALKMLENENQETIAKQMTLFQERILPDLSTNIKCGNSLISSDYWDDKDLSEVSEEEIKEVNAFDWEKEFKEVFEKGGFDAVIGNPPYLSMEDMETQDRKYYYSLRSSKKIYETAMRKTNLYAIFVEKSIDLTRKKGYIGMITPYSWFSNSSFRKLRKLILENHSVLDLTAFPVGIFQDAGIATSTLVLRKNFFNKTNIMSSRDYRDEKVEKIPSLLESNTCKEIPQTAFLDQKDLIVNLKWDHQENIILKKITNKTQLLSDFVSIDRGCDTANNKKYTGKEYKKDMNTKKLLTGKDFGRFWVNWAQKYLYYLPKQMKKDKKTARPGDPERFESRNKIIVYRFLDDNRYKATIDRNSFYTLGSTFVLNPKNNDFPLEYFVGIINSSLIAFYNKKLFSGTKVTRKELGNIPVRASKKQTTKEIVENVRRLEALNEKYLEAKSQNKKNLLQNQIMVSEKNLNERLFRAYEINRKEVNIIEKFLNQ